MIEGSGGFYAIQVSQARLELILDCRPQFYIPDMVKIMKGNTARKLFIEYPELKEKLWGGHLWNPSYLFSAFIDTIRKSIQNRFAMGFSHSLLMF